MVNPQNSPEPAIRLRTVGRVWLWVRVALLLATWGAGWLLSFAYYRYIWGEPPRGYDLWINPLTNFLFLWPASFAAELSLLLSWLPTSVSGYLALFGGILFWPCYFTLVVMWLRTGRVRYFGLLAAMTVPASILWHHLTVVALGV
jgi:hypothetical protein